MKTSIDINQLIAVGESQTVEFKTSFTRETIETLVAFANDQGGTVLVGISDDGSIKGVTLGKETLNEWLSQIKSSTSPTIIPDLECIEIGGKIVVSIFIQEYPVKPINTKGKYYRRIATSNHQLSLSEIANLYMQSLQLSWDSYEATNHSIDDLSVVKIEKFIDQVNQGGRFNLDPSPILALEKLKYLTNGRPSWAAVLLFA